LESKSELLGFVFLALFLLAGIQALLAGLAFFLGGNAAAMRAFFAFSFGLFATSWKLLVGLVFRVVVGGKSSRPSEERESADRKSVV